MSHLDALVIGAGFSGLYQLLCLRDRLGLSVKVLEAAPELGGTWYWNRYPGARCDSESHSYCYFFSRELLEEWDWSERYPEPPEILRYLNHVADRFDLQARHPLQHPRRGRALRRSGEPLAMSRPKRASAIACSYLITAVGCLSSANVPKIPGLESFAGRWYHTGQWPHGGRRFQRQARRPDRHRLDRHPGGAGDRRDGRPPDGVPAHRELQRAGAQRAAAGRVPAIRQRAPRRDPRSGALDAERPSVPHRRAQGLRRERRGAAGDLRGGVGEGRAAVPRQLPRHAARQGGERHGGRIHQAQDPRDRQGSEDRGRRLRISIIPMPPSARRSTPTISRPSTATTSRWSTCAPIRSSASRRAGIKTRARPSIRWTSSSSPPASTR